MPHATSTPRSRWAALPVLLAGVFMVVLDFFIVNVALPSIATGLDAGDAALEWVVAGYGVTFAITLITAGRLGDELGRRRVFAAGLALFTAASVACGLAPDPTTLIAARFVQGVAGAVVMPQVLSILNVTYAGEDRVRALGIYGLTMGLAAVGGQIVGGALVETDVLGLGWRGCFLINLPIGVVALALTARLVPESRSPQRTPLDAAGAALLATVLVAVLLPLIEGRAHGWPLWTWLSLAAAPLLAWRFLAQQAGRRTPLVDLDLFRRRTFSAGLVTQLCLAAAQASFFVYLALYLQQGRGLGALEAGLVFGIVAVAYVAVSGAAPAWTARHGRRVIAAGGLALAAGLAWVGVAVAALGTGGSLTVLAPGLALTGAGIGLCLTPLTATVLSGVAPHQAGAASGVLATTQQVGFALGVAVTGLLFFAEPDVGRAFEVSLLQLAVVALGVLAASRLLPERPVADDAGAEALAVA